MGKWSNRYSRRRYNPQRYMYQEHTYYPEIDGPHSAPDNVPSWEKEFCARIGCVPWRKIVFTRKCMFGHEAVLNWDASAGEEAFQNAKHRFWAKINGLPCENSLPDPDIYVEKVNWSSHIDAELIEEVDRAYFNPEVIEEAELKDEDSSNDNPWKRKRVDSADDLKCEDWGTLCGATSTNELGSSCKEDNPWEQGFSRGSQPVNWQQWRSPGVNNSQNDTNPWERVKNNQLGDPEPCSWGCNAGRSKNLYTNPADQRERGHIQDRRFSNEGRWRDQPRDGRNWNNGCRKREDFHQGGSGYQSSRYQRDDYQTGNHWSRGRATKRIGFAGSRY